MKINKVNIQIPVADKTGPAIIEISVALEARFIESLNECVGIEIELLRAEKIFYTEDQIEMVRYTMNLSHDKMELMERYARAFYMAVRQVGNKHLLN